MRDVILRVVFSTLFCTGILFALVSGIFFPFKGVAEARMAEAWGRALYLGGGIWILIISFVVYILFF